MSEKKLEQPQKPEMFSNEFYIKNTEESLKIVEQLRKRTYTLEEMREQSRRKTKGAEGRRSNF